MGNIAIQFSSVKDFGSELIRFFDHGAWSHVDAVLNDGSLLGSRDDVIANIAKGVQIRPASYLPFTNTKKVVINVPDIVSVRFHDFLHGEIGKGYDETAILGFVVNRNWRDPDKWFCSELISQALEQAEVFTHKLAAPNNKITPADLFLLMSAITEVN